MIIYRVYLLRQRQIDFWKRDIVTIAYIHMSIIKFFVKMLDIHFFKFGMEYPRPPVKIKFILCATIYVDQL